MFLFIIKRPSLGNSYIHLEGKILIPKGLPTSRFIHRVTLFEALLKPPEDLVNQNLTDGTGQCHIFTVHAMLHTSHLIIKALEGTRTNRLGTGHKVYVDLWVLIA